MNLGIPKTLYSVGEMGFDSVNDVSAKFWGEDDHFTDDFFLIFVSPSFDKAVFFLFYADKAVTVVWEGVTLNLEAGWNPILCGVNSMNGDYWPIKKAIATDYSNFRWVISPWL